MTRTTPRRRIILHFGQRRFTEGDTFIVSYLPTQIYLMNPS
jgi:hypothetical protein